MEGMLVSDCAWSFLRNCQECLMCFEGPGMGFRAWVWEFRAKGIYDDLGRMGLIGLACRVHRVQGL